MILFSSSLGVDKLEYDLKDYMDSSITSIQAVESSLVKSLSEIEDGIASGRYSVEMFDKAKLPEDLPKGIKGAINTLRISVAHIRASGLTEGPSDVVRGTFAYNQLKAPQRQLATDILSTQYKLIDELAQDNVLPPIKLIAELGLSIETLFDLRDYLCQLEDAELGSMRIVMFGGQANFAQAKFVVGPVAKRMAELEGSKLGGFLSDIIIQWMSGVPLSIIHKRQKKEYRRLEDLITVIYSRIQFLLPWGLFAADTIIDALCVSKKIRYSHEVQDLAYLADAGVPNFDALRLTSLEVERVDATRLAHQYHKGGGLRTGMDIVSWLAHEPIDTLIEVVRNGDNRRVDYDFVGIINMLRNRHR